MLSESQRKRPFFVRASLSVCAGLAASSLLAGCLSKADGIAESRPAATTVKMDFFHKPLPDIPLPNDVATVVDSTSATGRRVNASMVAPTVFEARTRELADKLDGWGVFQPITIPFTGPLDIESILAGHRDEYYQTDNDVVYVIDIDPRSPDYGKLQYVDIGNGNYPVVLDKRNNYWDNDVRSDNMSILFEEVDEDVNHNGILDPGEDTDADGVLDKPNYLPGAHPAKDDLGGRADALMTFYESETNTLIVRLLKPLRERTTYAVVVTRRIKDIHGEPVGSPFSTINHSSQTNDLKALRQVLPPGLKMEDIAFAFTYTTQSIASHWRAVRDGLYGYGVQRHLSREYPAVFDRLLPLRDPGDKFPGMRRPFLMWGENWLNLAKPLVTSLLDMSAGSAQYREITQSFEYVDYFVIAEYQSPQLFPRTDANGKLLPLNDQSWPPDLDLVPAKARPESVFVTIAVPRKEVSARGQGKPAPTVIVSHGYGSNRFEGIAFAGYLARHGLASVVIDGPSHGISLKDSDLNTAQALFSALGYEGLGRALLSDRAFDQDNDGRKDSGADFWTSYLFHTRDVVRQFMLDYTQLIRIMRSWDGKQTWPFDLEEDGQPDIAGDFDGDGLVDIGGEAPIHMVGGSLGGIMSMVMGGAEPAINTIVPIAGGGGYCDMGMRTVQGGAIEGFVLRLMGPLFVGDLDTASGNMNMRIVATDLNSTVRQHLGAIAGVQPGDTMVVENLTNGAHGCGQVTPEGKVRASLQSDKYDYVKVKFYAGPVLEPGTECQVKAGAQLRGVLENFAVDFKYHGEDFYAGRPLQAIEDGLGRARSTPEIRRLQAFAQLIMDPGDPAVYGPHLQDEPIEFSTGERTGAHALVISSQGDMAVPTSAGATHSRTAGIIDFLHPNPRLGTSEQNMVVDTYTSEAVDSLKRFTDSTGKGVHLDVENFSNGDDIWGPNYPRLNTPLRIGFDKTDKLGGKSAAIFPLATDTGQHAFDLPGEMTDKFRDKCKKECTLTEGSDPCGCRTKVTYDIGSFLLNMAGHFIATNGQELNADLCNSHTDCSYLPPRPPARDTKDLP